MCFFVRTLYNANVNELIEGQERQACLDSIGGEHIEFENGRHSQCENMYRYNLYIFNWLIIQFVSQGLNYSSPGLVNLPILQNPI